MTTAKRLLLDTHVVLWWLADDERLSARARNAIAEPGTSARIFSASKESFARLDARSASEATNWRIIFRAAWS